MTRANWQGSDGLAWRELQPYGVEVRADLSEPLSSQAENCLVQLLWNHGLLLVRKQRLSMSRQRELVRLFGPILIREGETGYLSNTGAHDASSSALTFHADAAYTRHPFDAIALHAVDVVDGASATLFSHAERALAQLPEALRLHLASSEVRMITPGFDILNQRVCDIDTPSFMIEAVRPVVVRNQNTGRDYINLSEMHAASIIGMSCSQSRDLINEVFEVLYDPQSVYEHRWEQGDLLVWDNQALQHARPSIKNVGKRTLQRVIVGVEGKAPHVGLNK